MGLVCLANGSLLRETVRNDVLRHESEESTTSDSCGDNQSVAKWERFERLLFEAISTNKEVHNLKDCACL